MKVDFATFCHKGDAYRLHASLQLAIQVKANNYPFDNIIVVYQNCNPQNYSPFDGFLFGANARQIIIENIDHELSDFGIDINKPQYISDTDKAHTYKNHVVNHIKAIQNTNADYIVFADNDCWMVRQPEGKSWVEYGIELLQSNRDIFIVSPNDGEPERRTLRMSQQMFLTRVNEFRNANFNQPGWDGNVNISGGPFPEYWALLEGRMELYCKQTNQCRYVLGSEYRYWHFNRLNKEGYFETDTSKY